MVALLKTTQIQEPSSATANISLDSSGQVGIGTSTPSTTLNVYNATTSSILTAGDSNTNNVIYRASTDNSNPALFLRKARGTIASPTAVASGDAMGSVSFQAYGGTNNRTLAQIVGYVDTYTSDSDISSYLRFSTTPAGSVTAVERMRIDSSGNLLVGLTSPLFSSNSVSGRTTFQCPNAGTALSTANTSGTTGYNAAAFYNNGATSVCGTINVSGTTTAYNTSSDYRLKENVTPMTTGLEKISALKPVNYDWISDKSQGEGFIAHELQAVIPAAVTGEKDAVDDEGNPVHQGVDYSKIVVHLVSAIQELSAKVDAQAAEIADLKSKIGA
jgi:hypothetical protein